MAGLDSLLSNSNEVTKEPLATGGIDFYISKRQDMETSQTEVELSCVPSESTAKKSAPEDPLIRAEKYLSKHDIMELFQHMTSDVAYRRPHDVISHMIDYITRLQGEAMVRKGVILTSPSR